MPSHSTWGSHMMLYKLNNMYYVEKPVPVNILGLIYIYIKAHWLWAFLIFLQIEKDLDFLVPSLYNNIWITASPLVEAFDSTNLWTVQIFSVYCIHIELLRRGFVNLLQIEIGTSNKYKRTIWYYVKRPPTNKSGLKRQHCT